MASPIVLIDPSSTNLPPAVVSYLQTLQGTGVARITLLGGSSVVPNELVSKIQAILSGTTAKITIGSNRNDVLKIMGKPNYEQEFNGSWSMEYEGVASIYLYPKGPDAKVIGWSCYKSIPEVSLGQKIASAPAVTLGSTKEDVVKACGTPI